MVDKFAFFLVVVLPMRWIYIWKLQILKKHLIWCPELRFKFWLWREETLVRWVPFLHFNLSSCNYFLQTSGPIRTLVWTASIGMNICFIHTASSVFLVSFARRKCVTHIQSYAERYIQTKIILANSWSQCCLCVLLIPTTIQSKSRHIFLNL